jgi:sugar transferase (PEP-CTERM/EpsH1 system associated)
VTDEAVGERKRILFLTPQLPYPPQQGTAIRNFNLIAQVAKRHEVHLLSFAGENRTADDLGPLGHWCRSVRMVAAPQRSQSARLWTVLTSPQPDLHHRLHSPAFREVLLAQLAQIGPQVIQVEGLEMAQYGLHGPQIVIDPPPLWVFDAHNAEHVLQWRVFETDVRRPRRWLGALYSWLQWRKLLRYESRVCRRANSVLACSAADAGALARLLPSLGATVVPNGVDIAHYQQGDVTPAPLGEQALVFTGKMDFRPNVDAVLWFGSHVWPRVRQAAPEAQFYIVGRDPHPRLDPMADMPGVTLTGFVDDIRPYIAAAAVYVVPLLTGGGTRLKVLEAMAMGQALVSTTLGCEGIDAQPGRDLVLADEADVFASRVAALLRDAPRREALGRAARAFVERNFDWPIVTAALDRVYER